MAPQTIGRRWAAAKTAAGGNRCSPDAQGNLGPMATKRVLYSADGTVAEESMTLEVIASIDFDHESGRYVAYVPSLPGCVSEGDTHSAARENIQDALGEILAAHKRRGTVASFVQPEEYVPPSTLVTVFVDLDDPDPDRP